ncbi:MAG: helix-turn-helix domain-containing protein [Bacteroidota bacterium]
MKELETYFQLNPENKDTSFEVKTMESVYELHGGKADPPHRHDYYTILLVKNARGNHKVDFKAYPLKALQVYFINPRQVHQVIEEEKSIGWIITFSVDFLIQNGINECFISDINLFRSIGDTYPLDIDTALYEKLENLCENMESCLREDSKFRYEAVSAYLKLFLIECNNVCEIPEHTAQLAQASSELLRQFKILVNKQYKTKHKVGDYAKQLFVTADHLNKVVKSSIGTSAKEYILQTILLEAKRQLIYTSLSSKEIGFELGFNDPAYFSNFFKKVEGISLSSFRKAFQK